jgi:hypothetical protein
MLASLTHLRRRVGAFIGGFEAELANRRLRSFSDRFNLETSGEFRVGRFDRMTL